MSSLSGAWREAAHDAYHTAKEGGASTVAEVTRACADAAVRVVLEHLIDRAKTDGDSDAVEAMYALEVELGEDDA